MRLLPVVFGLALLAACAAPEPEAPADAAPLAAEPLRVDTARVAEGDPELQYAAELAYPQLAPAETAAIRRINATIADTARAFVASIRPDRADLTGDPMMDRWIMGEIQGSFGPVLLQDDLFSTLLTAYVYTGGAHGTTVARPLAFDLRTGQPIALRDLFRSTSAYLDTLATLATARLGEERGDTDWLFDGAIPPIPSAFSAFALRPDSLLLYFAPYSVAAYAFGPSEVRIAYAALDGVLDPVGPVARLRRATPADAADRVAGPPPRNLPPGSEGRSGR